MKTTIFRPLLPVLMLLGTPVYLAELPIAQPTTKQSVSASAADTSLTVIQPDSSSAASTTVAFAGSATQGPSIISSGPGAKGIINGPTSLFSKSSTGPADSAAPTNSAAPTYSSKINQEKIPCLRWADETVKAKAVLFCIHGLGLHKGCYEDFGRAMAKQGLITYAIDVRGFGEWIKKGKNDKIDFDGTLIDIKRALVQIRSKNPGLPVIVLGESMGGGIGIHATALYPELIDGLISSVPAGERYGAAEESVKIGMHAIFGMGKKMDVGTGVIKQATKKEDLRERWGNDPLARKALSPGELIAFQNFMNKNFEEAALIKDKPVLVIQGAEDKLVIPAGTVKLYNSIASFNKGKVLSKTAEHLIFEEGQFSPEDLNYVTNWIDKKVIARDENKAVSLSASAPAASASTSASVSASIFPTADGQPGLSGNAANNVSRSTGSSSGVNPGTGIAADVDTTIAVPAIHIKPSPSASKAQAMASIGAGPTCIGGSANGSISIGAGVGSGTSNVPVPKSDAVTGPAISYWIELYRGGKVYRCNNKIAFKSGDAIRFHIIPKTDGYAYLLMKQGSSGKRAILFPSAKTGENNYLKADTDYPVPYQDWLSFDDTPGIERVSLLFSHMKVLTGEELNQPSNLAYVSNDRSGAKDLVPTRMQLSWDDPTPVILPDLIAPSAPGARRQVSTSDNGSMVKVSFNDPGGLLAVDVALAHQ